MRDKQLNVRLTFAEHRAARHWAYVLEMSVSELARVALMEKIERLEAEKLERDQQLTWTRGQT